jgi:hypothetical protein
MYWNFRVVIDYNKHEVDNGDYNYVEWELMAHKE